MGRREPSVQRLIELKTQGITPEFARDVQATGYPNLGPWELIELHDHGVDGDFIRKAVSQSGRQLLVPEILELHARGGIRS